MYKYDISLEVSMTFIAKLFGHTAIDFLQSRCTAYMISHILLTYTEHQATYFINEIAGLLVMSVQDLITSNFHVRLNRYVKFIKKFLVFRIFGVFEYITTKITNTDSPNSHTETQDLQRLMCITILV